MRNPGFTLLELLIVVSIISILATIAIPNFLSAQIRSKVSRTKAELQTLGSALEIYHIDYNCYPREGPQGSCMIACDGLPEITTPISYLTSYPKDIFHLGESGFLPILYGNCNSGSPYWYIWSYGPDRMSQDAQILYDPTNGTISEGDIKRTSASSESTVQPQE